MLDKGDTVERMDALIGDGFAVRGVASDDDTLILTLERGDERRTLHLGRRQARRLLAGALDEPPPVHA
jgi:hypothetical protein